MLIIKDPSDVQVDKSELQLALEDIWRSYGGTMKTLVLVRPGKAYNRSKVIGITGDFEQRIEQVVNANTVEAEQAEEDGTTLIVRSIADDTDEYHARIIIIIDKGIEIAPTLFSLIRDIYQLDIRTNAFLALQEINSHILGTIDKWKLLQKIVNTVTTIGEYKIGYVTLVDGNRIYARTVSESDFGVKIVLKLLGQSFSKFSANLDTDDTYTIRAIKENKIYIGDDFAKFVSPPCPKPIAIFAAKITRVSRHIALPITINNKTIGTLNIASDKDFSNNEVIQLKSFADQIAIAISTADLMSEKENQIKQVKSKNQDLESLFELTSNISQTLDPKQVVTNAVNSLPQDANIVGAFINHYDHATQISTISAMKENDLARKIREAVGDITQYAADLSQPQFATSAITVAIRSGQVQYTDDLVSLFSPPIPRASTVLLQKVMGARHAVIYPITSAREVVIGTITYLLRDKAFAELDDNQKQLFSTYALQIGIALENATLFTNLQTAMEQIKEVRRQERDMLDVMGHELRTPISIVRNGLLMLDREYARGGGVINPVSLRRYLDMTIESVRREITLIETLLSATKVDASRMQLYYTKVDLKDVINDGIEGQRVPLSQKNLQLIYTEPQSEIFVYCDRTRSQEVMDNFLNNAVKYTNNGTIEIKAWQDKGYGWISIKDSGIGIAEEDLQNLGKKFFRARQYVVNNPQDTKVVRPGGTGLGLYVTFDLIRLMGGMLYINSKVGEGSTFTFSLPAYAKQMDMQIDETFAADQGSRRQHVVLNDPDCPKPPAATA